MANDVFIQEKQPILTKSLSKVDKIRFFYQPQSTQERFKIQKFKIREGDNTDFMD